MLVVRCRQCNKELSGSSGQSRSCGCPNMTTIKGDSVTAVDLTKVIMVNSNNKEKSNRIQEKINSKLLYNILELDNF